MRAGSQNLASGDVLATPFHPHFDEHEIMAPTIALYWRRLHSAARANTTGSAQPTVPLKVIRKLPVVLPSIEQQGHTIERLDALRAKTDYLQQLQSQNAVKLEALLPSVLDRAFKGEL